MEYIVYIIAVANVLSILHLGLFIAGANVYDIKKIREKKKLVSKQSFAPASPVSQPMISVIVPAHNEEKGIIRTLNSLQNNSYRNTEVIVVDDGSTDTTSEVVRRYKSTMPRFRTLTYMARTSGRDSTLKRHMLRSEYTSYPITLVRQKNGGKGSAVNNGIQNHAKGSLIMTLDADSMVHPQAIKNAVSYFQDERIIGVAANVRVMGRGWLGTLQRFEHMIGYRSKKFYTLSNCEFIVGGVASTYRKSVLKQVGYYDTDTQTEDIGLSMKLIAKLGNRNKRIVYAADVVAMTEGVLTYRALIKQRYRWKLGSLQNLYKYRELMGRLKGKSHSRMLTLYRLPAAVLGEFLLLLEPLMMAYIIYLSISLQSIGIFLGAYITITLYTLWNIWPDEHINPRQKLRMSLIAFIIYPLFYSMTLVQLLAVFKSFKNYKKIYDLTGQSNTWVSPARALKLQHAV